MPRLPDEYDDEDCNPNDQADGFYGGREDDDAFEEAFRAAAAATGDVHDAAWAFLFRLEKSAARGEWDDVRSQLAQHKGEIPFHAFSRQVLRLAGVAGEAAVAETLLSRQLRLPDDEAEDMLAYFARVSPVAAAPVMTMLLERQHACPDSALFTIAAAGAPETMELFRKADADIQLGGSAFSLALHSGNTAMMTYLYNHGAEIHRVSAVAGINGGMAAHREKHRANLPDADAGEIAAVYAFHVREDIEKHAAFYAPATVFDASALQAAAKAGRFSDVVESGLPVTVDDMLRENEGGASALSVLAAQGSVAQAFDARLWHNKPEEAMKLHAALASMNLQDAVDPAGIAADLQQHRLKERAKAASLRLKPGR